jgi:hypothetical protein
VKLRLTRATRAVREVVYEPAGPKVRLCKTVIEVPDSLALRILRNQHERWGIEFELRRLGAQ